MDFFINAVVMPIVVIVLISSLIMLYLDYLLPLWTWRKMKVGDKYIKRDVRIYDPFNPVIYITEYLILDIKKGYVQYKEIFYETNPNGERENNVQLEEVRSTRGVTFVISNEIGKTAKKVK